MCKQFGLLQERTGRRCLPSISFHGSRRLQSCLPPLLAAAGIDEAVVSDDLVARLLLQARLRFPHITLGRLEDAPFTPKLREALTTPTPQVWTVVSASSAC